MRPATIEDINYRQKIITELPELIKRNAPDNWRFHATTIYWTLDIISDGQISSGIDRFGVKLSFDPSGVFSVTNPETVNGSLNYYIDVHDIFLPYGCVFIVIPQPDEIQTSVKNNRMKNLNFKNEPDRLVRILCSRETIEMVRDYLKSHNLNPDIAQEYLEFAEELKAT